MIEWKVGELVCSLHSSVSDLPDSVWDENIAGDHPMKSSNFLHCLEMSFPDRRFCYFTVFKESYMVGLGVITEENFDIKLLLPGFFSRPFSSIQNIFPGFMKFKLAMVGTFESMGEHWWFDRQELSSSLFAEIVLGAIDRAFPLSKLLIIRDFESHYMEFKNELCQRDFRSVLNLPLATILVENKTVEEYIGALKGKNRATIRKALRKAENSGIKIERLHDFEAIIDECYPLYLQVHNKATEFKREPIPKDFFYSMSSQFPSESSILSIRNQDGDLLAFMLTATSDSISNPFLIGMDYRFSKKIPLYYLLLWGEITYAIEQGCHKVDMGITSYFVKQTMGATLNRMSMAARIQPKWLRPLLNPLLPMLLDEKQPDQRSQSKQVKASST